MTTKGVAEFYHSRAIRVAREKRFLSLVARKVGIVKNFCARRRSALLQALLQFRRLQASKQAGPLPPYREVCVPAPPGVFLPVPSLSMPRRLAVKKGAVLAACNEKDGEVDGDP